MPRTKKIRTTKELDKIVTGVISKMELSTYAASKKYKVMQNDSIDNDLFTEYKVYRGLRDRNGKGVLTGLTGISDVYAIDVDDEGNRIPVPGELWYRGYQVKNLIAGLDEKEFGFEKVAYLLMFGDLPNQGELDEFKYQLANARQLPSNFIRDVIMKASSKDIMNSMTRSILTLASYDNNLDDNSIENNIRQSIELVSLFPLLAAYSYHAHNHYNNDESMYIHRPDPELSTAENFLRVLRPDSSYTDLEAKVLDTALIVHMEHGGGNNSTFTTRVVTSTGTDTYSAVAAGMSSLKGFRHGGANIKVRQMMHDIRDNVGKKNDRKKIKKYLIDIMDRKTFDRQGLIYGIGHAIYSISDPREEILKDYVIRLAKEKGEENELELYEMVEEIAPELIMERKETHKGVTPNVDFYSGFVYEMLGIPLELYTPLFAIARIVGWCAHRMEEITGSGKIIRPAYKTVMERKEDQ